MIQKKPPSAMVKTGKRFDATYMVHPRCHPVFGQFRKSLIVGHLHLNYADVSQLQRGFPQGLHWSNRTRRTLPSQTSVCPTVPGGYTLSISEESLWRPLDVTVNPGSVMMEAGVSSREPRVPVWLLQSSSTTIHVPTDVKKEAALRGSCKGPIRNCQYYNPYQIFQKHSMDYP